MKVPKKTAITLLAMLCFTSQTHAFVVTDLATDVLMPLVQSQLGDLSNISDLNLEEQYKQLSQLESIYDELKSGDAISELEWGDLFRTVWKRSLKRKAWIGSTTVASTTFLAAWMGMI